MTAVDFHPYDDSYFVSGGFDKKLRVWSIPDGRVIAWAHMADVVTAVRYTPSGMFIVAGLIQGQVYIYSTDGTESLRYYTQLSCKNRHGKSKNGTKVTGLSFVIDSRGNDVFLNKVSKVKKTLNIPVRAATQVKKSMSRPSFTFSSQTRNLIQLCEQLLVTTNDSRLRLFGLHDYCMISKYKGLSNTQMQIKAHFSESGNYIICGSEDSNVYMWKTGIKETESLKSNSNFEFKYHRNKTCDSFKATEASIPIVTDALFVPEISVEKALLNSNLFPTLKSMKHINCDLSSSMVISSDYSGTIRVFIRRSCLDAAFFAAGPEGYDSD